MAVCREFNNNVVNRFATVAVNNHCIVPSLSQPLYVWYHNSSRASTLEGNKKTTELQDSFTQYLSLECTI